MSDLVTIVKVDILLVTTYGTLFPQINVESDGVDGETAGGGGVFNSASGAGGGPIQTTTAMSFSDMVGIESVNSNSNASLRSSGSSNSGSGSGIGGGGGTFASAK